MQTKARVLTAAVMAAATIVAVLTVVALAGCGADRRTADPTVGHGRPTLLVFVDPDSPGSRTSAVVGVSMASQYGPRGLRTMFAVVADLGDDALTNLGHDWHLGDLPVLRAGAGLTRRYGVRSAPVAVLVDSAGVLRQRWDGPLIAQSVAPSIQRVLAG